MLVTGLNEMGRLRMGVVVLTVEGQHEGEGKGKVDEVHVLAKSG